MKTFNAPLDDPNQAELNGYPLWIAEAWLSGAGQFSSVDGGIIELKFSPSPEFKAAYPQVGSRQLVRIRRDNQANYYIF